MGGVTRREALALLAAAGLHAAAAAGCVPRRPEEGGYRAGEARSFGGKPLDPIEGIPENSIDGPQYVDRRTYRLRIDGLVGRRRELGYDDVLGAGDLTERRLRLSCVEGWDRDLLRQGVRLRDVLRLADPRPGATTLVLHAADGYSTSVPLEYALEEDLLLAYRVNDLVLPPERGFPLQLIAEGKWGYKSCKWVQRLTLSDDESFRGYWEQRGYSNDGDLDEPSLAP